MFFVNTDALLLKENGPLAVELDSDSNNKHRQREKNYTEKG
jgi:hypothetical protein